MKNNVRIYSDLNEGLIPTSVQRAIINKFATSNIKEIRVRYNKQDKEYDLFYESNGYYFMSIKENF